MSAEHGPLPPVPHPWEEFPQPNPTAHPRRKDRD